jgi:hypothetical protein
MENELYANGSNTGIIRTQLILGLLFIAVTFISFYRQEDGDMGVIIFGTLLYLPFVLLLCIYNGLTIGLFERLNKKVRLINYCLPTIPLLIWFVTSDSLITIRYWHLRTKEFSVALSLILLTNLTGYYFFKRTDRERPAANKS